MMRSACGAQILAQSIATATVDQMEQRSCLELIRLTGKIDILIEMEML
jgi:hypothetical protein